MHKFSPDNHGRLESDDRYRLLAPTATLAKFGLKSGMTVVDIGAGTGFFSRKAAEIVGTGGTVYAADMSQEMISVMTQKGLPSNVRTALSTEYSVPIAGGIADLTILAFVVHENSDVPRLLKEASRVTKKTGRIAVIEWKKENEEHGPPKDERLGQDELIHHLGGFTILEQGELNKSHFYIIFQSEET
jgi:ubiquinone/menaquinone biosynthesis C-methylase UbiE